MGIEDLNRERTSTLRYLRERGMDDSVALMRKIKLYESVVEELGKHIETLGTYSTDMILKDTIDHAEALINIAKSLKQ